MILLAVCSALTLSAQESLILHYDFRDVQGRTVIDKSSSHFDGKPLTAPLGLMEHADKNLKYSKLDVVYVKQ